MSIICQFLRNFWQFFPQFFYKMFCQFNYLLNYCRKSIVKSIIFSIIAWCGLVEPGFESSLNPSLDSEGEGLSRVWTQAYNWPIWGSVSDPCPCLPTRHFFKPKEVPEFFFHNFQIQAEKSLKSVWIGVTRPPPPPPPLENVQIQAENNVPQTIWIRVWPNIARAVLRTALSLSDWFSD